MWLGEECSFSPSMLILSAMASDLHRVSEGVENTLSLARKLNSGGADPVFASTVLWHFLQAAGRNEVTREEAYTQMMGESVSLAEKAGFRVAYIQAVLPSVDMGKKPVAPAKPTPAKKGRSRK